MFVRNFDYHSFAEKQWDNEILNYLSVIHEARGRQSRYLEQKAESLERLVEIAKIQSTASSNAIEGIRTTETRLKKLMDAKTAPRNRDEREILGYRDALNVVHESFAYIPVTPNYILQLHKILFSHTESAFGGQFKNVQNYISAADENGNSYVLFTPLPPYETPAAMQALCDAYNVAIGDGHVDPLLLIPVFIHDFLCIHPFIDGNGRMSRLLTTLLLYRSGYTVGKYISLETKISETKDMYYSTLQESQSGWLSGEENAVPFIKYMLGIIISAYRDLEDRIHILEQGNSALTAVREAVKLKIGKFTKSEICALCPALSQPSVERSLRTLCETGEIEKTGAGRSTAYLRKTL